MAAILAAEGEKEARIKLAEGEAQAIMRLQEAKARGIEAIRSAKADQSVIALKSLETFEAVANGKATKIIIPSELQNLSALVEGVKNIVSE